MESDKTAAVDALHWQETMVFAARPVRPLKAESSNWEPIVLAAVFFLHAALIAYGYNWQEDFRNKVLSEDEALQVSFIDRIAIPDSAPSPSRVEPRKTIVSTRPIESAVLEEDAPVPSENVEIRERQSLRLTLDVDDWKPTTAIAPRDPLKRQFIALAGRAEPFIHGIKLSEKMTAQQRLQQLGKLFGAVDYDPCKEARNRMASGHSPIAAFDLEQDLRTIERHCRP